MLAPAAPVPSVASTRGTSSGPLMAASGTAIGADTIAITIIIITGAEGMKSTAGGGGPQGGQGLLRSFHELNLRAQQQQQLHSILSNAREQFATQQPGGAPDMMVLANPGDPNYAAAVQAAKKRAADRIQRDSDLKLQLYNVLTPDQKTQWSKLVANWKARMAQRAEGPKGQPDPANR